MIGSIGFALCRISAPQLVKMCIRDSDGVERKYIEEVGAMNIFFKINGTVVTPMLNGSILPGVTRASCIDLCKHWGLPVAERRISVDELVEAARTGEMCIRDSYSIEQ